MGKQGTAMRKTFLSFLLAAVLMAAPFSVFAQQGGINFQSSVTYQNYDPLSGSYPFGANSLITLYPAGGASFPATSSGDCGYPYPTSCRGLKVVQTNLDIQFFSFPILLLYVSPTQINAIISPAIPFPPEPRNGTSRQYFEVRRLSDNQLINAETVTAYRRAVLPIVDFNVSPSFPLVVGTLYDSTGTVVIKALHDGAPNPRTYNGQPTVAQVYFTGLLQEGDTIRLWYSFNPFAYLDTNATYDYGPGVSLTNAFAPQGGWPSGLMPIRIYYASQPTVFDAFIYWAN